jgi:hypothetical protein
MKARTLVVNRGNLEMGVKGDYKSRLVQGVL